MEGSSKKFSLINSHFFKPLLPGFDSNFAIPKSFNKYLGEDIEEADEKIAILRNYKVKDNLWMVKVCYFDDKLNFKNGWEKFCKDHGLQIGDFLVFKHHQNLVFDVFVFDSSCCERPFPGFNNPTTENVRSSSSNIPSKKGSCKIEKGQLLHFSS
ncbi:B3 domain-containing protein REM9-like [Chenopodium quinoa]|uniref:B3 domain-containing protein REM9-like n=1 Tax=Chenopodium quinoa TaxID=63459 RepID=UPI000B780BC6|nr:B3 domain-containing protein REM9-like [Chenopodium quinoa]